MNLTTSFKTQTSALSALAHPVRLEILDLLRGGEACVCHIQANLDLRQAYISQHLKVLHKAGILSRRKSGLRVYYRVADASVFSVLDSLNETLLKLGKPTRAKSRFKTHKPCSCPQCAGSKQE